MWSRLFLTSLCILCILAIKPLAAADKAVQLQMQHEIDKQCNGTADASAQAIPGSCIIYSVTAINTSNTTYRNVSISAHVPANTTLVQAYRYSHNQQLLPSTTLRDSNGMRLIRTQLDALQPGEANKISVRYSVRIN